MGWQSMLCLDTTERHFQGPHLVQQHLNANESASPDSVQVWSTEEENAQLGRHRDVKVMDIYDIKEKKRKSSHSTIIYHLTPVFSPISRRNTSRIDAAGSRHIQRNEARSMDQQWIKDSRDTVGLLAASP
jgi:hypothetical protein